MIILKYIHNSFPINEIIFKFLNSFFFRKLYYILTKITCIYTGIRICNKCALLYTDCSFTTTTHAKQYTKITFVHSNKILTFNFLL